MSWVEILYNKIINVYYSYNKDAKASSTDDLLKSKETGSNGFASLFYSLCQ